MAISIMVSWRSYGPAKTYNIYYSLEKDYGFVKANGSPVVDNPAGNSFEITGSFALEREYWVFVVEHKAGLDLPENIVGNNPNYTFPILNKVCVETYTLPTPIVDESIVGTIHCTSTCTGTLTG